MFYNGLQFRLSFCKYILSKIYRHTSIQVSRKNWHTFIKYVYNLGFVACPALALSWPRCMLQLREALRCAIQTRLPRNTDLIRELHTIFLHSLLGQDRPLDVIRDFETVLTFSTWNSPTIWRLNKPATRIPRPGPVEELELYFLQRFEDTQINFLEYTLIAYPLESRVSSLILLAHTRQSRKIIVVRRPT